MSLGQFSVLVGTPKRWVQNAFQALSLPPTYTVQVARRLAFARAITEAAVAHLLSGATLLVEHGHDQGPAVQALFHQHGYHGIHGFKDLAGIDRVVGGKWATFRSGNLGT